MTQPAAHVNQTGTATIASVDAPRKGTAARAIGPAYGVWQATVDHGARATVTHLPTGRCVGAWFDSELDAVKLARKLGAAFPTWRATDRRPGNARAIARDPDHAAIKAIVAAWWRE